MIVLAIAGIALSAAIPSFQGMVVRNRIITQVNEFVLTLNLARSEALRVGGTVSIRAELAVANDTFGNGWCVVVDRPRISGQLVDALCVGTTGTLIRRFPALTGITTLDLVSPATGIQFNSLGGLVDTNPISVDLCYPGYDGRRIVISPIGRSKSHRPDGIDPSPSC